MNGSGTTGAGGCTSRTVRPDSSRCPKVETKDLQRQILHHLLDRIPAHPAAHGFRRGRSVHTAAAPHCGRAVLVRLGLEAFFASVGAGRVYGTFRMAGYPEPVAHALTGLCTTDYDRLRAVLDDAAANGSDHANRHGHPSFREHLEGRIAWAGATNEARAAKLRRAFERIGW